MDDFGEHEMLGMGAHLLRQAAPNQQDLGYAACAEAGWEDSSSEQLNTLAKRFKISRGKSKKSKR